MTPAPKLEVKKTVEEQIAEEKAKIAAVKKKSIEAWGKTGETKSFGLWAMLKFTVPRLWKDGCF